MADKKDLMMILSIVPENHGVRLMKALNDKGINLHFQCVGIGTAPTEMMDIFGLCSNDKDIVISVGSQIKIKQLMAEFNSDFNTKYGGLMIVLKMSAANRLIVEILNHNITRSEFKGDKKMKNEHLHNLILISVNSGFADSVMTTARTVGATGGTIIKGRLAGTEQLIELGQTSAEEEREIICILAPQNVSHAIMEKVNTEFGSKSDANGIICAVPTEKAYKI